MWNNVIHGEERQWYESGQLKSYGQAEYGHIVAKKEWDTNGHLIRDFVLPEDHVYRNLIAARRRTGPPMPDPLKKPHDRLHD